MKKIILSSILTVGIVNATLVRDSTLNVVHDNISGLVWQDTESLQKSWSEALNYCENLEIGDYTDWRLPNKNELLSIVDYSKSQPSIDNNFFINIESSQYWTSTTVSDMTSAAWLILFDYGQIAKYIKTDEHYVRCVRSGEIAFIATDNAKTLKTYITSKTTKTGWFMVGLESSITTKDLIDLDLALAEDSLDLDSAWTYSNSNGWSRYTIADGQVTSYKENLYTEVDSVLLDTDTITQSVQGLWLYIK